MGKYFFTKKVLIVLLVVFVSATTLPRCKKIVDKVFSGFDITLTDIPTTIPPIPIANYTYSIRKTWDFNLDSIVKAQTGGSFGGNDLTSVKVKQATFRLQNADSATNLSNLQTVTIRLNSDNNATPVTIATANVPDTATTALNFDTNNSPDILPYLKGTKITYIVTVVIRKPPRHTLDAFTDMILSIK